MSENKKTKTFRITEITEWEVNRPLVQSNADHNGEDYNACLAAANEVVDTMNEVGGMDLPFICEAENEDDALAQYAEKYAYELAIPVEAEIEEVHKYVVYKQVDCRTEAVVFAKDPTEAGELAEEEDFDLQDLEVIETHLVNAIDCETNETIDLHKIPPCGVF